MSGCCGMGGVGWGYGTSKIRMGGIGAIVSAPFFYTPDLGPVGSGASYFPRDTTNDAKALNFLGFMPDQALSDHPGSMGSQAADMGNSAGAWDAGFRAAVTRFQTSAGLVADSWIGPSTRTALAAAVVKQNLTPVNPPALPPVIPVAPGNVPVLPGTVVPGTTPVASGMSTGTIVGLVAAGAAVLGLGWYALR